MPGVRLRNAVAGPPTGPLDGANDTDAPVQSALVFDQGHGAWKTGSRIPPQVVGAEWLD